MLYKKLGYSIGVLLALPILLICRFICTDALHRVYLVSSPKSYFLDRLFMIPPHILLVMAVTIIYTGVVQIIKKPEYLDKYMARGSVLATFGLIVMVAESFSDGWLLMYIARFLRLVYLMSALYALVSFIGVIYALIKNKI